MIVENELHLT